MEGLFDKKHIYGNFQDQPDSNRRNQFPLDIETLESLQNNTSLAAAIGNLTGSDKAILCGCDGTPRTEGYVWMKTPRAPITGELLYYPGGGAGSDRDQCHIVEDDSDITIDSTTYAEAYTTRHLANGAGATTYTFGTFAKVTLAELLTKYQEQHAAIEALEIKVQYTFVRGMIMLWSGNTLSSIPDGWALCDGTSYTIDGETFWTPDLRDRFVVGARADNGTQDDVHYNTGERGGSATITLTEDNMPAHTHTLSGQGQHSHDLIFKSTSAGATGKYVGIGVKLDSAVPLMSTTEYGGGHSHNVGNTGGGQPFDNRPPYYALAYIMKL